MFAQSAPHEPNCPAAEVRASGDVHAGGAPHALFATGGPRKSARCCGPCKADFLTGRSAPQLLPPLLCRREHMAMDANVRAARAACDAYAEDSTALTAHVHAAAAAREDAERDLAVCRRQVASMRADWQRKLRDRRKEVPFCFVLVNVQVAAGGQHAR